MACAPVVVAVVWWLATGLNIGWTKTSVPVRALDETTGLEAITYEKRFVPGVDFLGASLLGSVILGGASLLFRKKPTNDIKP